MASLPFSTDSNNYRQQLSAILAKNALDNSPIQSPWQGAARMANALLLGMNERQADADSKDATAWMAKALLGQGGADTATPATTSAAPSAPASPNTPVAAVPSGDMSQPRGIRNNNPLNIEAGSFTQGQPGFAGSDGRFAKFSSPDQGAAAAGKLLDIYANKHGLNTVAGIVGRWAPAGDGNNVSAYASDVSGQMGVDPNAPLNMSDPAVKQALIAAMARHENGRPVQIASLNPTAAPPAPVQTASANPGFVPQMPGVPTSPQPQTSPAPTAGPQMNPPDQPAAGQQMAQAANPQVRAMILSGLNSPNPAIRAQAQALAGSLITQQLKPPSYDKLNDDTLFDKATGKTVQAGSGYRPLVDPAERARYGIPQEDNRPYQIGPAGKLINPPAETRVTVDQRGEGEFTKEAGKLTAQRYSGIVEDVPQAKQMLSDIQTLQTLGKQIGTGKEAEVKAALGPYAQALGINIDKLPEIQAYEAIINRVAPSLRVKGSGAQSDYELKNFLKSLPSLGNTPEGNQIASTVMQGLYDNKLKAAEIASAALNGEITRKEADKQLRELPDPMEGYRKYMETAAKAKTGGTTQGGVKWSVE